MRDAKEEDIDHTECECHYCDECNTWGCFHVDPDYTGAR